MKRLNNEELANSLKQVATLRDIGDDDTRQLELYEGIHERFIEKLKESDSLDYIYFKKYLESMKSYADYFKKENIDKRLNDDVILYLLHSITDLLESDTFKKTLIISANPHTTPREEATKLLGAIIEDYQVISGRRGLIISKTVSSGIKEVEKTLGRK